jgi:hypothetical protein
MGGDIKGDYVPIFIQHSTTGKKGFYKIFIKEIPTYIAIVIPISNAEEKATFSGSSLTVL